MIHPIDIVIRTIFPPAKPRDDIDYIIKQIKEVPSPPEREPKEGECDIRKPGAACFADMQEDLVSADDGIQDGYLDVNPSDSITGETTTTENVGGMSGSVTFTGGTGTSESWYNGVKVSGDISADRGSPEADALTGDVPADAVARAIERCKMHSKCIYGGDLDVSQADSITGETTNTENVGGNVSWMDDPRMNDPRGQFVEKQGNVYDDKSYDQLVTKINSDLETFSPLEFDLAAPLLTDQPVIGEQLEAVGSDVCQQLEGVVPKWDLPFGCNQ